MFLISATTTREIKMQTNTALESVKKAFEAMEYMQQSKKVSRHVALCHKKNKKPYVVKHTIACVT